MKKLLALLLALAMILTFAACGESNTNSENDDDRRSSRTTAAEDESTTPPAADVTDTPTPTPAVTEDSTPVTPPEGVDSFENSRTKAAFDFFLGESYYMEMAMEFDFFGETLSMSMKVARRGDDIRLDMDMMGQVVDMLILNRAAYIFDQAGKKAYFRELSAAEMKELIEEMDMTDAVPNFKGAILLDTGTGSFQGRNNLYYEEIKDADGNISRVFFSSSEMIGLVADDMETALTISSTPAASLFTVPAGYTQVKLSDDEFEEMFELLFG
jgi:hypothetical protein